MARCTWFCCLHDHVAHLAHMPRLHYIGMHTLPLELSMIEVEFTVCLCAFHSTLKLHTLVLWAITHWNARLVVREPRTMSLSVVNMIKDVLVHTLLGMHCHALFWPLLLSKQVPAGRYGRSAISSAGRLSISGQWLHRWSMTTYLCRWPFLMVGGIFQCSKGVPWDLCSLQRRKIVKTEATCACRWVSERSRAYVHWALFPKRFYHFISLVNLLN